MGPTLLLRVAPHLLDCPNINAASGAPFWAAVKFRPMKQSHFYNSRLAKVPWLIRRFGLRQMLLVPIRRLLAARIIKGLPKVAFSFDGERLFYFYHRYNLTWINERAVEVPIAMKYVRAVDEGQVLEIGNVLSHYYPVRHTILDKYEAGPGITNCDIVDFTPERSFGLIISISTFEHIGFDDDAPTSSGSKIAAAVRHVRGLLSPGGKAVLTVPIGYNPELDEMLRASRLETSRELYLVRTGRREWISASKETALQCRFNRPLPYANAIAIVEFEQIH